MRARYDDWWTAGMKRAILLGSRPDPRSDEDKNWAEDYLADLNDPSFEEAKEGDAWRIVWGTEPQSFRTGAYSSDGPLAGYCLTCIVLSCDVGVHMWMLASNCGCMDQETKVCCHMGAGSCWEWTGDPEGQNLSASPSLHAASSPCGFHGHLRNGVLSQ